MATCSAVPVAVLRDGRARARPPQDEVVDLGMSRRSVPTLPALARKHDDGRGSALARHGATDLHHRIELCKGLTLAPSLPRIPNDSDEPLGKILRPPLPFQYL